MKRLTVLRAASKQAVVGELPQQAIKRDGALGGNRPQPVGDREAQGTRVRVGRRRSFAAGESTGRLTAAFVASDVDQMFQQACAVAAAKAEATSVRCDACCEEVWVVQRAIDHLGGHLGEALRLDVVAEQVPDRARGACDRHTGEHRSLSLGHGAAVDAYVAASRLVAGRQRELVDVGGRPCAVSRPRR